jgi:two-component system response regulator RegX3
MTRVLLVEDDEANSDYAELALRRHGYDVAVATTGAAAQDAARRTPVDVILLDLGLPDVDGIQTCRRLRAITNAPIIIVSGQTDEAAKVMALDAGGDDYVTKPFSVGELTARIRAVLRRHSHDTTQERIEVGGIALDPSRHVVVSGEKEVVLTPKEFDLLQTLMTAAGRVIPRQRILDALWGSGFVGDHNVLDVHVSQLRRKLDQCPGAENRIQTVRGIGYRFSDA